MRQNAISTYEMYEDLILRLLERDGLYVGPLSLTQPDLIDQTAIYVSIEGAAMERVGGRATEVHLETIRCAVHIVSPERRGEEGVYSLYDEVCEKLIGKQLPGAADSVIFEDVSNITANDNWYYLVSVSFSIYRLPAEEDVPQTDISKIVINTGYSS